MRAKNLDQFYTAPEVAENSVARLIELAPSLGYELEETVFYEPSAGTGSFLKPLVQRGLEWIAGDLEPKYPGVIKEDFLEASFLDLSKDQTIILGNPPFGKKGRLALEFLNRGLSASHTVAFVLPLQFRKYLTQKQVHPSARLVLDQTCPPEAFIFNGKPYEVRCSFQVWTTLETDLIDLRKRTSPPTSHPDFEAWIYNATPEAERFFDEDWEFAVRRQGWGSFAPIFRDNLTAPLEKRVQWMLFKPNSVKARENLLSVDFEELANKNTSVRGFGKADLVEEYVGLYGAPRINEGLFAKA